MKKPPGFWGVVGGFIFSTCITTAFGLFWMWLLSVDWTPHNLRVIVTFSVIFSIFNVWFAGWGFDRYMPRLDRDDER